MSTELFYKKNDLFDKALINPAKNADTLHIISGYATPSMVMDHMTALNNISTHTKIKLIVGMTASQGIQDIHHENFKNIMNNTFKDHFFCSYVAPKLSAVHSKVYIWLKENQPIQAFCGSANYTRNGFKNNQIECLTECNPNHAMEFYDQIEKNTIFCDHQDAESLCKKTSTPYLDTQITSTQNSEQTSVLLPLFSERDQKIQDTAGLNWGQRGIRERNEAYIPIPSKIAHSTFFPEKGEHFSVLTDEGFPMVCVRAQDGGKAIHTPHDNSIIGKYFRERLGVTSGEKVELSHLNDFGSRYVKFTKIDEGDYLMEFLPQETK